MTWNNCSPFISYAFMENLFHLSEPWYPHFEEKKTKLNSVVNRTSVGELRKKRKEFSLVPDTW